MNRQAVRKVLLCVPVGLQPFPLYTQVLMSKPDPQTAPSHLIDQRLESLGDWGGRCSPGCAR